MCIILGVSILSPTLAGYITLPHGEAFSEMWLLGPDHLAEGYPFNITSNQVYNVYLGVADHMGDLEYYLIYAELRNQTDPLPDVVNGTPSGLNPLSEYRFMLSENATWEQDIPFSVGSVSFAANTCRMSGFSLGGISFSVDKSVEFDQENNGFYFQLIFELWRYNAGISAFEFHNRFVGLWLNVTQTP